MVIVCIRKCVEKVIFLKNVRILLVIGNHVRKDILEYSEKDRQEKDQHIRENHTFGCEVYDFKHNNKEVLEMHLLTCTLILIST